MGRHMADRAGRVGWEARSRGLVLRELEEDSAGLRRLPLVAVADALLPYFGGPDVWRSGRQ